MKRKKRGWDRKRGWGPWRENWVSICSRHASYDSTCDLCVKGTWDNHWEWLVSSTFFKLTPRLWVWWINR